MNVRDVRNYSDKKITVSEYIRMTRTVSPYAVDGGKLITVIDLTLSNLPQKPRGGMARIWSVQWNGSSGSIRAELSRSS